MTRRGAILALGGLTLAGCGGGGEDTAGQVRVRVRWPALGRATKVSAYANSLRITLPNARTTPKESGSGAWESTARDVVFEVNRPSDEEAEVVYRIPDSVKPGKLMAIIEAFSQANQRGRQLQMVQKSVLPDQSGLLPDVDLRNGEGAITSVVIGSATPPAPGSPEGAMLEVKIGQEVTIQMWVNSNFFNPVIDDELKWDIFMPDTGGEPIVEGLPVRTQWSSYKLKPIRTGLISMAAIIDGVRSNTFQFRVVP